MRADEFKHAFLETWEAFIQNVEGKQRVISAWQNDATWTTFMLGERGDDNPNSFLHSVGAHLN